MNQSIESVGAQRHRSRRKRHFRLLRRIAVLLMLFLFLVLLVDLIEYQPQAVLQPGPAHVALGAQSHPDRSSGDRNIGNRRSSTNNPVF